MTRLRARLAHVVAERESGYVAVFVALCLPLLVGMCALAVDVATWHVEGTKAQRAADAAALAGTIYLPTSQSTAFTTATDLARLNGYSAANGDSVTVSRTVKPTQLRVTITTTVNNSFGVIFGRQTTKVTRTAVAGLRRPHPHGQPVQRLRQRADGGGVQPRRLGRVLRPGRRLLDEHRRHEHEQGPRRRL